MIVDVHTHVWDSLEQLGPGAALGVRQRGDPPWSPPDGSPQGLDAAMKPVRYAFILGLMCRRTGTDIPARRVAAYVARRPDRYLGFAGIDPTAGHWAAMLDEAVALGLHGVVVSPAAQDCPPTDARALRLLERCQRQRLPVMVHPGTHLAPTGAGEVADPAAFDAVARDLPELRLVIAQVGFPMVEATLDLLERHAHVYADASDLGRRPGQLRTVILAAHERGVAHKLLLGSDYPFGTPRQTVAALFATHTAGRGQALPQVPREAVRGIVEHDALACLGIPAPLAVTGSASDSGRDSGGDSGGGGESAEAPDAAATDERART